ncbi:hypothetical protein EJ08DRAFT_193365 [Tothia fuscella]|uniref:Methyltransferase n=1 Tax=Tothia fuscella TaxID=1048955 RepID=A0A9P4NTM7_9PEZI|nr:hypothetical protein EJ08DRAFT_193365 [Tothia fuscella]
MVTSTIESQLQTISVGTEPSSKAVENGVAQSRDLDATIYYYDEATDLENQAKPEEPEDSTKPIPKVHYPETPRKAVNLIVKDISGKESEYTLDQNGFQLSRQVTKVILTSEDLANDDKIKNEYYPEMQAWLKEVTGAPRVKVYHHGTRQSLEKGVKFTPGKWGEGKGPRPSAPPVYSVHLDQSSWESYNIIRRHMKSETEALLHKRVVIVNAWRPIKTVRRDPFGIADASTVPAEDIIPRPYKFFDETRETTAVRPNEKHRWYFKSHQQADEVLIFKGFDSHGNARACPHSAFVDQKYADDELRESIEIRALLIYDDFEET